MSNMRLEFLKAAWRDLDSITVYISLYRIVNGVTDYPKLLR